MANILGKPIACTTKTPNVGQPNGCVNKLGFVNGLILTFDGFEVPLAKLASFAETMTYFQEQSLAENPIDRCYFIPFLEGWTDNTPAPEEKKTPFGNLQAVTEQPIVVDVEFEDLGIEFYKNLRGFNDRKDVRIFTISTTVIGGEKTDTGWRGFEGEMFSLQVKTGTVTGDYNKYTGKVTLKDAGALTDNIVPVAIPKGYVIKNNLGGIRDVVLSATATSGHVLVSAVIAGTYEDFNTKYAAEISAAAVYSVNGTPVTPTSVVDGIATLTATSGEVKVKLVSPDDLVVAGIGSKIKGGFESNEITVTVP